uniref:Uncharacterized protein n=1 Tax=Populus trichocarpa TaxID=3694 RepID=U5FIS1_POPTR
MFNCGTYILQAAASKLPLYHAPSSSSVTSNHEERLSSNNKLPDFHQELNSNTAEANQQNTLQEKTGQSSLNPH